MASQQCYIMTGLLLEANHGWLVASSGPTMVFYGSRSNLVKPMAISQLVVQSKVDFL